MGRPLFFFYFSRRAQDLCVSKFAKDESRGSVPKWADPCVSSIFRGVLNTVGRPLFFFYFSRRAQDLCVSKFAKDESRGSCLPGQAPVFLLFFEACSTPFRIQNCVSSIFFDHESGAKPSMFLLVLSLSPFSFFFSHRF